MANHRAALVRMMRILQILREGRVPLTDGVEDSARHPNGQTLAKALECSSRTILRDLDALRDAGCRISYDECEHTLCWENRNDMNPVPLMTATDDEVLALSTALALSASILDNATARRLKTFLGKLEKHLNDGFLHSLEAVRKSLSYLPSQVAVCNASHWTDIQWAILEGRGLELIYASPHNGEEPYPYALEPFRLAHLDGAWYVIGRKRGEAENDLRLFRLNRIQSLKIAGWRVGDPPDPASIDRRLGSGVGAWQGDDVETVRLRIAEEVSCFIRERAWNPSHRFTEGTDGDLLLEFETAHAEKIIHFVLEWSPHIELLEPARLRPQVAACAQRAWQMHG